MSEIHRDLGAAENESSLNRLPAKKSIKFDSWSQTGDDLLIILHAGFRLKANDISVEYTDKDVKVGLTDGRKWACTFWQPVKGNECSVKLRKMKIHLDIKKQKPGLTWSSFEVEPVNVTNATSASKLESHVKISLSNKSVSQAGNCGNDHCAEPLTGLVSDAIRSKEAPPDKQLHQPLSETVQNIHKLHPTNHQAGDVGLAGSMTGVSGAVKSNVPSSDIVNSVASHAAAGVMDLGLDADRGDESSVQQNVSDAAVSVNQSCSDLTTSVSSMEINPQPECEEHFHELSTMKYDFYETNDKLMLAVFMKNVVPSSLRVTFEPKSLRVVFQTSDSKFHESVGSSGSSDIKFSWTVELRDQIVTERCSFKAMSVKTEITLVKRRSFKWDNLVNLNPLPVSKSESSGISVPPPGPPPVMSRRPDDDGLGRTNGPPPPPPGPPPPSNWRSSTTSSQPAVNAKPPSMPGIGSNSGTSQKPVCNVSPISNAGLNNSDGRMVCSGGWTGLNNLGNTCFMNSVLQVLSNTPELKQYFLSGQYKKEINTVNPLGMKGDLAKAFSQMMRALWGGSASAYSPSSIKTLVAMKQNRFAGFLQHDAEEFMEFLLDGLHEDLNRIINKPYSEDNAENPGKPDNVLADESWKKHTARNDSHIVHTFQGQFRSKVTCPICHTVSLTFDPFSVMSVPIPKKKKLLHVVFIPKNLNSRPVKYQIYVDVNAKIKHVKDALNQRTQVHPNNIRIMKVHDSRVVHIFDKDASVAELDASTQIVACEVLSAQMIGEPVKELLIQQSAAAPLKTIKRCCDCKATPEAGYQLKACTKCHRVAYCDKQCQKRHWPSHRGVCKLRRDAVGCPYIISFPVSSANYRHLYETMDAYSRYSVNAFQPPASTVQVTSVSAVATSQTETSSDVESGKVESVERTEGSTLEAMDTSSEQIESSDKAVRHVIGIPHNPKPVIASPPFHIEIGQVTESPFDRQILNDSGDEPLDLNRVSQLEMVWNNAKNSEHSVILETKTWDCVADKEPTPIGADWGETANLHDCLRVFCEPEVLAADQTWYCPRCKLHCRATKEMSLWRLPRNLIIHLKRFSFANVLYRNKISELVDFPLRSLDVGSYCQSVAGSSGPNCTVYDLYGVINHHGGMLGGHYTSYAKTPSADSASDELGWREFDDSNVRQVSDESRVVTSSAYVLFYRCRSDPYPQDVCSIPLPTSVEAAAPASSTMLPPDAWDSDDDDDDIGDVNVDDDRVGYGAGDRLFSSASPGIGLIEDDAEPERPSLATVSQHQSSPWNALLNTDMDDVD